MVSVAEQTKSRSRSGAKSRSRNGADKLELIKSAAQQLAVLTGKQPEKVLGLERTDDGLRVKFELVEMTRIPHSTDLLGCYVVEVDEDGDLLSYERRRRYHRGQTDEDGG
jgi:hypothetical protein